MSRFFLNQRSVDGVVDLVAEGFDLRAELIGRGKILCFS